MVLFHEISGSFTKNLIRKLASSDSLNSLLTGSPSTIFNMVVDEPPCFIVRVRGKTSSKRSHHFLYIVIWRLTSRDKYESSFSVKHLFPAFMTSLFTNIWQTKTHEKTGQHLVSVIIRKLDYHGSITLIP